MTILYADDDPDDCELVCEALHDVDPSILFMTANDGYEALAILRKNRRLPDYIFLDINMPKMDGKTCLLELKKDQRLKNIPVVIYSTTTNTNEIVEMFDLGAFEFISKAHTVDELRTSLNRIIGRLKAIHY